MLDNKKKNCKPQYKLLSEEQIEQIHLGSLEILADIGVQVSHEEGLKLLEKNDCIIEDNNMVRIPNELVEECVRSAPSIISIYNRNGEETMKLGGDNIYFGLGTDLLRTVDLKTDKLRPSVLQDVKNAAIVSDYCQEVDFIASFALPSDVPKNLMYFYCVKAMVENSLKPIFFTAAGKEDLEYIIRMTEIVAGGETELKSKPFIIHYSEPTAPRSHSYGAVSKLFLCAQKEIPICYTPADLLGGTSPVTLAGGIVQANAEALSGIVLHQLKNKGAPIISGFGVAPLDMKSAVISYGAPELRLTNSAFADMFHHYNIPMWSTVGSDSHCLDQQAAMEHTSAILLAAMDGANLIHDIGYLGQGLVGNPVSIVMCDEIISYVKRFIRGFNIDRNLMAIDVIRDVGPRGDYLTHKHTLKHFREELWQPKFINRDAPESWINKGSKSYGDQIKEHTLKVLKTHNIEPLNQDIQQKLDRLLMEAEKELIDKKFRA
ncbi:MAG: trimethylamine methyltransferase family protein [Promethearchaeota archaeon]|jgi:trimethylamine--corrinoid protein Co-methyltransferase